MCIVNYIFPCPEQLNDPFDCKVLSKIIKERQFLTIFRFRKEKLLESILNNDELRKLFNQAKQDIKNHGVFSGSHSSALKSSLMWSHYADKHRGVCLIYAIPTEPMDFFNKNQIIGIQNIIYGPNQLTDWFKKLPANKNIHNCAFEDMINIFVKIKHISWKYEDEVRMIRETSGIVSIDTSYLQHVCFGLDTSEDKMTLIREILIKFNYDVGYSRIQRAESDFGIESDFAIRAVDID